MDPEQEWKQLLAGTGFTEEDVHTDSDNVVKVK